MSLSFKNKAQNDMQSRFQSKSYTVKKSFQKVETSDLEKMMGFHFNPGVNGNYWGRRPVTVVNRILSVGSLVGSWYFRTQVSWGKGKVNQAEELRKLIFRLGPAAVKIVQAISSRPDLIPPNYAKELEQLQDRMPAFPNEQAIQTIEGDNNMSIDKIFLEFGDDPIAAASLGQVYRAKLKTPAKLLKAYQDEKLPITKHMQEASQVNQQQQSNSQSQPMQMIQQVANQAQSQFTDQNRQQKQQQQQQQAKQAFQNKRQKIDLRLKPEIYQIDDNPSNTYVEAAVKVQRPGVYLQLGLDVFILRYIATRLMKYRKLNTDLASLVDEWAIALFQELDYENEAANASRFKQYYASIKDIYSPEMFLEFTSHKVLVMEWVDGTKLTTQADHTRSEAERDDSIRLVEIGVKCSLEQMLSMGFYHADPHPGNLLRLKDGRLCYIDFGMMGEINFNIRQGLIRATVHLVNQEFEQLAKDFIDLGFLPPGSQTNQIIPALTGVFQEALQGGVSNLSFSELSENLGRTMYQYKFRIPAYYTLLVRSLSVLEGIALQSDPNYKVLLAAYPWVSNRLITDKTPQMRATLQFLLYKQNKFQFERLEAILSQAVRSNKEGNERQLRRMQFQQKQMKEGLVNGDDQPTFKQELQGEATIRLLLSPSGQFLLNLLTDEMAKGMDAALKLSVDYTLTGMKNSVRSTVEYIQAVSNASSMAFQNLNNTANQNPYFQQFTSQFQSELNKQKYQGGQNRYTANNAIYQVSQQIIQQLNQIPKLSDQDDQYQVEGLQRLVQLLYNLITEDRKMREQFQEQMRGIEMAQQQSTVKQNAFNSSQQSDVYQQMQQQQQAFQQAFEKFEKENLQNNPIQQVVDSAKILQWLIQEAGNLNQEERQVLLEIPIQIISKLSSRLAAGFIRNVSFLTNLENVRYQSTQFNSLSDKFAKTSAFDMDRTKTSPSSTQQDIDKLNQKQQQQSSNNYWQLYQEQQVKKIFEEQNEVELRSQGVLGSDGSQQPINNRYSQEYVAIANKIRYTSAPQEPGIFDYANFLANMKQLRQKLDVEFQQSQMEAKSKLASEQKREQAKKPDMYGKFRDLSSIVA